MSDALRLLELYSGACPEGWMETTIGKALIERAVPVPVRDGELYRLVSIRRRHGGMFEREVLPGRLIKSETLRKVVPGSFVIARRQIVHGACAYATEKFGDAFISSSYLSLVGRSNCDTRYFAWLGQTPLLNAYFWLCSQGVVVEKFLFDADQWLNLPIYLPPIVEQRAIVSVLDAASVALNLARTRLAKLRRLREGLLHDVLEYGVDDTGRMRDAVATKTSTIGALAEINPPPPKVGITSTDPVTFIPMSDALEDGTWAQHQTRLLSEVQQGYTRFGEGDILVAKITPCMENGKRCHAINLCNRVGFGSTEFHVLRPKDQRSARFLLHLIGTRQFRLQAEAMMIGSAGQRRVPSSFFNTFPIPSLTLEEQERIALRLDQVEKRLVNAQEVVNKRETIFRALRDDLLMGGTRVTPELLAMVEGEIPGHAVLEADFMSEEEILAEEDDAELETAEVGV